MPSRRAVLASTVTVLAVPGCVGDGQVLGDDGGTITETPTPTSTATATDTGGETTSVATDVRFELHHREHDEEWVLFTGEDVRAVGDVSYQQGHYYVPMTLAESGRTRFAETFDEAGVYESHDDFSIHTVADGETVFEAGISRGLVDAVESGEWDGRFRTNAADEREAERLAESLRADES